MAVLAGGNIRVGLEDNIWLDKGVLATNGALVERAVKVAEGMGARRSSARTKCASALKLTEGAGKKGHGHVFARPQRSAAVSSAPAGSRASCSTASTSSIFDPDPEAERKVGEVMKGARRAYKTMVPGGLPREGKLTFAKTDRRGGRAAPTSSRRACRSGST